MLSRRLAPCPRTLFIVVPCLSSRGSLWSAFVDVLVISRVAAWFLRVRNMFAFLWEQGVGKPRTAVALLGPANQQLPSSPHPSSDGLLGADNEAARIPAQPPQNKRGLALATAPPAQHAQKRKKKAKEKK